MNVKAIISTTNYWINCCNKTNNYKSKMLVKRIRERRELSEQTLAVDLVASE
jgi:hypothetical protein